MQMHPLSDHIAKRLAAGYPAGEASALARHILELRFGITRTDLLSGRARTLSSRERQELDIIVDRLLQKEPVQYILEQAEFCGRIFRTAPGVLIPRPETEELVHWIIDDHAPARPPSHILDIGTGSGCIAVTLALTWPGTAVTATDISTEALAIARENAVRQKAPVVFRQEDILAAGTVSLRQPAWDLIVSNPPYICESEQEDMEDNVLSYEPHVALFVPDDHPLLFYEAIGRYALRTLRTGGSLYVEINQAYGLSTVSLFRSLGFSDVTLKQDSYGNDRMIKCRL